MLDFTKPVQTRNGYPVTIYTTTAQGEYPIHGAYRDHGTDRLMSWTSSGKFSRGMSVALDLINCSSPEEFEFTGYVGITRIGGLEVYRYLFHDPDEARKTEDFLAIVPVTIKGEVGDGITSLRN